MSQLSNSLVAECPSCNAELAFPRRPKLHDVVICEECDESLLVVGLLPLKLDWAGSDDFDSWEELDDDALLYFDD